VGNTLESNFNHIQDAINNASNGDIILVKSGVYQETLKINKSIQLIGENQDDTIILSEVPIEVNQEFGDTPDKIRVTILTLSADNCIIKNFSFLASEKNNIIRGIIINSNGNSIINCNISGFFNAIKFLENSENNSINQNIISNNVVGIEAIYSDNNIISDNYILNNSKQGVIFETDSNDNIFKKNIFIYNGQALRIKLAQYNQIFENYFYKNFYGVYFCCSARYNIVYKNTFILNGEKNAHEDVNLINYWNADSVLYGNYWDDYTGDDENGDGIGDTNYKIIGSLNSDNYPLMNPLDIDYYYKYKFLEL
jgi:parallel beta-helix repeat protein